MGAISLIQGIAKGVPEMVFLQPQRWRSAGAAGDPLEQPVKAECEGVEFVRYIISIGPAVLVLRFSV